MLIMAKLVRRTLIKALITALEGVLVTNFCRLLPTKEVLIRLVRLKGREEGLSLEENLRLEDHKGQTLKDQTPKETTSR